MCDTVESSKKFNRLEYERQRAEYELARMREYQLPEPVIQPRAPSAPNVRTNLRPPTIEPVALPPTSTTLVRTTRLRLLQSWNANNAVAHPAVSGNRMIAASGNCAEEVNTNEANATSVGFGQLAIAEKEFIVRFECPPVGTATLSGESGVIGGIGADYRELENGVRLRRMNKFLEFVGNSALEVSVALNYGEQLIRLRMCNSYVIIAEILRMEDHGTSRMALNVEALSKTPPWEVVFGKAPFTATRVRFNAIRAILVLIGGELRLQNLPRML